MCLKRFGSGCYADASCNCCYCCVIGHHPCPHRCVSLLRGQVLFTVSEEFENTSSCLDVGQTPEGPTDTAYLKKQALHQILHPQSQEGPAESTGSTRRGDNRG